MYWLIDWNIKVVSETDTRYFDSEFTGQYLYSQIYSQVVFIPNSVMDLYWASRLG